MYFDKLKEIFLMVTTECNWSCKHCYLPSVKKMSYELIEQIIKELGKDYKITFLGGEILTDWEFIKYFPEINQNYILTNGLELIENPHAYDTLKANGIDTISLSYYFDYEQYFCGVDKAIVEKVIEEAKKQSFTVTLNTVIGNFNVNDVQKMCARAVSLNVDGLRFHNYINMGNGAQYRDYLLDTKQIELFFEQLQIAREKFKDRLVIKYHRSFGACPGTNEEKMKECNRLCWAGTEYIVIDANKKIYSCPFIIGEGLEIGEYKDGKLVKTGGLMEENRKECIAYYYT